MIERPMPQDIMKHKAKIMGNLTARQLIWGFVSVLIGAASFFTIFAGMKMGPAKVVVSALPAIPTICIGFITIFGQPFEKIIVSLAIDNFLAPATRKKEIHFEDYEKWRKLNFDELQELDKKVGLYRTELDKALKAEADGTAKKKKKPTIKKKGKSKKQESDDIIIGNDDKKKKKDNQKSQFKVKPSKEYQGIK